MTRRHSTKRPKKRANWSGIPFCFNREIVNEISAAFSAKYPGIKAEGTRNVAQVIFQKLNQEMQAGIKNVDVFASTINQLSKLKKPGKADAVRASS